MVKDLNIEDFRDGDIFGLSKNGRCFRVTEKDGELIALDKNGHGDKLELVLSECKEWINNIYNRLGLFGNSNEDPDILYEFGFKVREEKNPEYIICSAIWFDDDKKHIHQPKNITSGYIIAGHRHHNCFETLGVISDRNEKLLKYEKEQGFITNNNFFVDRKEAAEIAYKSNQIKEIKKELYSEDLY